MRNKVIKRLIIASWEKLIYYLKSVSKLKNYISINGVMARHSSLFFTVSMLLLVKEQVGETSVWELVPILGQFVPSSEGLSVILKLILIVVVLILVFAMSKLLRVFNLSNNLQTKLKWIKYLILCFLISFVLWLIPTVPLSLVQLLTVSISIVFLVAVFWKWLADIVKGIPETSGYWFIFLMVYFIGWAQGLVAVQGMEIAYRTIFFLGLALFCVIFIVTLKAAIQPRG